MRVDIQVDAEDYVIRDINPNDTWDAGEYGLRINGVVVTKTDYEHDEYINASSGDPAVVLVEHYSDGSTFGSCEYAEVKGIFKTLSDAEIYAGILNKDHGYFGTHIDFLYFQVVLP